MATEYRPMTPPRTLHLIRTLIVSGPFLFAAHLGGQTVQGRVVEAGSGRPVVGANVLLLDSAGRRAGSVLTDGGGRIPPPR